MAQGVYPDELSSIVSSRPAAKGLAVIISNDYATATGLKELRGTLIDGILMKATFEKLQFATLYRHNLPRLELMMLLRWVARFRHYPPSYRRIAIVFSGHGTNSYQIYAQDGKEVKLNNMFQIFYPEIARYLGSIPKLFFIDACRGNMPGGVAMVPRGGEERETIVVPQESNFLVAYSTTPGHLSYEEGGFGGVWMSLLARKLLSEDASVLDVLTKVNAELVEKYQGPGWAGYAQQPELLSRLNEEVYLLREARREQDTVYLEGTVKIASYSTNNPPPQPAQRSPITTPRQSGKTGPPTAFSTPPSPSGSSCSSEASPQFHNTTPPNVNQRSEYQRRLDSSPPNLPQVPMAMTRGKSAREKLELFCVQKEKPQPTFKCTQDEHGHFVACVYVAKTHGWVDGCPRPGQDEAVEDAAAKLLKKLSIH